MRSEQIHLVKAIGDMIGSSDYVYFISYTGAKVKDFSTLRDKLAAANASCHVLKNSLIRKAGSELELAGWDKLELKNDTAMVYGKGDCGAVAKVISEFGKSCAAVQAKGGYLDGAVLGAAEVAALADLPAKPVLQAMLLGVLQAPARNLVTVLNAKASSIVNVINAYKDKLENSNSAN